MAVRGAVVIIDNDRVATIKRVWAGRIYFLFPGGGAAELETPEEAARREAYEELGVVVELERLLAIVQFRGDVQFFYLAKVLSGDFGTGTGEELSAGSDGPSGTHTPAWLPLAELHQVDIRPKPLAEAIASGAAQGWNEVQLSDC